MNNRPTQEQTRELWEQYGLSYKGHGSIGRLRSKHPPPANLTNLFEIAAVKVDKPVSLSKFPSQPFWTAKIGATIQTRDKDPALALFWALRQAKEAKGEQTTDR